MKSKTTTTKRRARSAGVDLTQLEESIDRTIAVVDAAVTGAIIGGVAPQAFEAVLSYWFLLFELSEYSGGAVSGWR